MGLEKGSRQGRSGGGGIFGGSKNKLKGRDGKNGEEGVADFEVSCEVG